MKNFTILLVIILMFITKLVLAEDFSITFANKYSMNGSVETPLGVLKALTIKGVFSDSRGHTGIVNCIATSGKNLDFVCDTKDEDGDISYTSGRREGDGGKAIITGGTGKYANITSQCEYQIASFSKDIMVGLITMQCSTK
jgi:hypothetical protein|tara:strand:- start:645 stop:1067 length:423 start_codon:yes stop_codon:yes gene_type:complete